MQKLDRNGFIRSYMVASSDQELSVTVSDKNQLFFEGKLRKEIAEDKPDFIDIPKIRTGDIIRGAEWKPYYSHGSIYCYHAGSYGILGVTKMAASSILNTSEDICVDAVLWTYMATAVYLNGFLIAKTDRAVYKPMQRVECTLNLKAGKNLLLFISENLGVRDTRNMLAFQICNGQEFITASIPDEEIENRYETEVDFLDHVRIGIGSIDFPSEAPYGTRISYARKTVDHFERLHGSKEIDVSGKEHFDLPEGYESCTLITPLGLARRFEFSERIIPEFLPERSKTEDHLNDIFCRIASITMLDRGNKGFAIFTLLARKAIGLVKGDEESLLLNDINLIKKRVDCAEFLVCGLLRYIHEYGLPPSVAEAAHEALIDFRYWMTMKGTDGMCFWSENHSLMFWFSAMDAGSLYPDEYFPRAEMTGKDLHEYGKRRVDEWLDDVLLNGFEEFQSSTYMAVTFAALLNVIDYSETSIADKAVKAADNILRLLACNTFKGSIISPMGRVYRGVIYPFRECTASLINAADQKAPYAYGEGWLSFMATSRYRYPSDIKQIINSPIKKIYSTGNALISVEKNDSYILTAVFSPRSDDFHRWTNTLNDKSLDEENNSFIKSLNECFHGTTFFQPGVYGYQQHMWSAALSGEAIVFANHPGTTSEDTSLRPGYWNGNGVMPAITAGKGMIASIYSIPEEYPVAFTHLYVPFFRFDESRTDGRWIFLAKDEGYLAIWASGELELYDEMIAGSELRLYSRTAAYVVFAGQKSFEDFDSFSNRMKKKEIIFDADSLSLFIDDKKILVYIKGEDATQYLN